MKSYLFIHGKNPQLSSFELLSLFGEEVSFQNEWLSLIETKRMIDQDLMDHLGGTVKICEVFSEDPIELILSSSKTQKVHFGLSQYGGHERISDVLISLKEKIKEHGKNARFVNKDFSNITTGQLNKSRLINKGVDLVRCFFQGNEVWAKTMVFQNIDAYSERDYDKPKRDMKVGMMPPKLCQMMINFSQASPGSTIYDPFVGLGGVVMEAVLMGFQVIGSDIKGRLIDSTLKNLEWLTERYPNIRLALDDAHFFQHDATLPFSNRKFPQNLAIVTEGYLGPPLLHFPDQQKQAEIFDSLHAINSRFFSAVKDIISFGWKIVICFPFFKSSKSSVFYPEEMISSYEAEGFKIKHELRKLLYERKQQTVGREVVVFEKII